MMMQLNKKCEVKVGFQGINLRDMLHKVTWKKQGWLSDLIEDIAAVRAFTIQVKDKDLNSKDYVAQLVKQVPPDYRVAVNEVVKAGSTNYDDYEYTLENYRDNFNIKDDKEDSDEETNEAALLSVTFNKKRFNCGEKEYRQSKVSYY